MTNRGGGGTAVAVAEPAVDQVLLLFFFNALTAAVCSAQGGPDGFSCVQNNHVAGCADVHMLLADVAMEQENFEGAAEDYTTAIKLLAGSPEVLT